MPTRRNVEVIAGDDPQLSWLLWDRTAPREREPADLTDAEVHFTLSVGRDEWTKELDPSMIRVEPPNRVIVSVDSEDVDRARTRYRLDVVRDGRRQTYAYGTLVRRMV